MADVIEEPKIEEPIIETPIEKPIGKPVGVVTQSIELPIEEPVIEEPITELSPIIEPPKVGFGLNDKLEADDVPEELKGKSVNDLINIFKNLQSQQGQPVQVPSTVSREQQMEELRANFYQDPIGSVAKMVELTIAPIIEEMQGGKINGAVNAVSAYPDYEVLKPDIDEFMANVPPHLKANPQSWQIAYDRARGKNFDKLVEMRSVPKLKSVPPSMPAGTGGSSNNNIVSLTAEEKHIAKNMGISEKEYAKWK